MSFQTALVNHTPFAAGKFVLVDPHGQEATLVVLAATFEAGRKALAVAEEQSPPLVEDVYAGDPAGSSLRAENELALAKPKVDVVVLGSAHAVGARPTGGVAIELRLGDIRKPLWVSGHREWALRAPTRAVPFVTMQLGWERAFGGRDPRDGRALASNPVGVGWRGATSRDGLKTTIPNIEYPDALITNPSDQPRPAGLGPIARWWAPRVEHAGTYDERWKATRWPLLPVDFDVRFNQIAPVDQQSSTISGGEPARLTNLTPEGIWEFTLPRLQVPVHLVYDARYEESRLRMDTVLIDSDHKRVRLTARLCIRTVRGVRLREIVLGHMTHGWISSRKTRKRYLDLSGSGGLDRALPSYQA